MSKTPLYIGSNPVNPPIEDGGTGEFVKINGETFFKIKGYYSMAPFFMTIVSSTDHWMFLASNGSLSAGRKNPESALFPYYTDDKIIDSGEITGSKTIVKAKKDGKWYLWEPFTERYIGVYAVTRNIYKNKIGNKVIFEEVNNDLELTFRYSWTFSEKYGFVKSSEIFNTGHQIMEIEILDGLRNLLPYGVNLDLQTSVSTLVDAYKKNELDASTGLGVFSLSSMIIDKAEPSEALKSTTVWSRGLDATKILLSTNQIRKYRRGETIETENFVAANKAAFFVGSELVLRGNSSKKWIIVAEVNQSTSDVVNLKSKLESTPDIQNEVDSDIEAGSVNLKRLVALADGLQRSDDRLITGRHFSNVLFNIMRGGIFENEYTIEIEDFLSYLKVINKKEHKKWAEEITSWGTSISYPELVQKTTENKELHRIGLEYLPLSFSRRHGDPSRPWNYFNIDLFNSDGSKKLNYEGNWRDIFQNWEALAFSYPEYVFGMITKFVNASTIDGYNPYRITRDGIDWEVIEPNDPWSYIGYWGDHQVIYLQKLLELAENHYPGKLVEMLDKQEFVYANVPYRIKGYEDILKNPNDTIVFDEELAATIDGKVNQVGSDGKLVWRNGRIVHATLIEKLLVMSLTKLYNFVPDGGIWLNTQRPEWNDANNALVGNGLSLVTLNYLRRFLVFFKKLIHGSNHAYTVHKPVAQLLKEINQIFQTATSGSEIKFKGKTRKIFVDQLGIAGDTYRNSAYAFFTEGKTTIQSSEISDFISHALILIEKTLHESKRADGLYHSYNLLHLTKKKAKVSHLYEMLEGQVAAMSSGLLAPKEALNILNSLKQSQMFREDQYSYMLYPNRQLKNFIEKNEIPKSLAKSSALITALIEKGDTSLVEVDQMGGFHFAGEIKNEADVKTILTQLKETPLRDVVENEEEMILDAFEEVFDHVSFTGRSGTFYGYEGLGSIYWHMVSKLLLAVQENVLQAHSLGTDTESIGALIDHYFEIRAGIGINKDPKLYGAFPTDAYSHTPSNAGAQQPGMTGQVKEDIINRWAELGLEVKNGEIYINPIILNEEEFLPHDSSMEYLNSDNTFERLNLTKGEMAFTYCGTLFQYKDDETPGVKILKGSEVVYDSSEMKIDGSNSALIFRRTKDITSVEVRYPFTQKKF